MLAYRKIVPEDAVDGAPLIVLLHGRGSDENDLLRLGPRLSPSALTVTPRAPFPGAPWGYGPGWAWYRFLGEDRPEPESFAEAQRELRDFLAGLAAELPVEVGPLVLGGFSQGGTMSLAYAVQNPGSVAGVLNFSGFIADHPDVDVTEETVSGTRFFWGHGTEDPAIPFELAESGRARLRAAGADLVARDYPIGHQISPSELSDVADWLRDSVS